MELEQRVAALESQIDTFSERLVQYMALAGVMRQCMTTLIASHPVPKRLQSEWLQRRDSWVDREMDEGLLDHPEYGPAYTELLAQLSQEIDRAAAR